MSLYKRGSAWWIDFATPSELLQRQLGKYAEWVFTYAGKRRSAKSIPRFGVAL